jgi:hypothetical protein
MNIRGEAIAIIAVKPLGVPNHIYPFFLCNTGNERVKFAFGRNNFVKDNLLAKCRAGILQTRVKEQKKLLQDAVSFDYLVQTNSFIKKKSNKESCPLSIRLLPGW